MATKVGKPIKEARQAADLTQEKLARKVGGGLTAADISKAERGELELPIATLRKIAKATGVTQASLVNAAQGKTTAKKTTEKKTTTKKTTTKKTTEKKTTEKKETEKKETEKKAKTPASANKTMKVTATEQKLINAYRLADSSTKKAAMNLLQGESNDLVNMLLGSGASSSSSDGIADALGDVLGNLFGGK